MADLKKDRQKALKNLNEDDFTCLSTGDDNPLQARFDEMVEVLSKYVDIKGEATIYSEVKSALDLPIIYIKTLLSEAYIQKLMRGRVECIAAIVGFKHKDIRRLPQGALESLYNNWVEIEKEVPQLGLNVNEINVDITTYLENADKDRLKKCV